MRFNKYQKQVLREMYQWYGVRRWCEMAVYFYMRNRLWARKARVR